MYKQQHQAHSPISNNNHGNHKHAEQKGYNPIKIPCDWKVATNHSLSRRVAKDKEVIGESQHCPCCGYQVEKEDIPFNCDPIEMKFLGSGFPLFYNFIKFCVFILFQFLLIKGIFCLSTDLMGNYCHKHPKEHGSEEENKNLICPSSFWNYISLANIYDRKDIRDIQTNLSLVVVFFNMFTLLFFRKAQIQIDVEIDQSQLTPSDYTICVKNIPKLKDKNIKSELKQLFQFYAVQGKDLDVTKVCLVYDIEELIEKEEELKEVIKEKQNILTENKLDFADVKVKEIDEKIEKLEHEIHKLEHHLANEPDKFSGIAFVSFLTEEMKNEVLKFNQHTQWQRFIAFLQGGRYTSTDGKELMLGLNKLFIESAPEPNDVDWEFIHITTRQKIKQRVIAWTISLIFMSSCFIMIWALTELADQQAEKVEKLSELGIKDPFQQFLSTILSISISWTIIFFNKFVIGKVYHLIVDLEKISSKTKFNISFAQKQSVALFINTAVISLVIDFFITGNIIGSGGFIFNETNVFLLNAFIPPIVWFVDPWSLQKDFKRNQELRNMKNCVLTQNEANDLMEMPDYSQAKRYGDIMKTMWFTFFYGDIIPIGTLFSITGLILYYYVDKFNVLRRRTIKENLSKDLSLNMIDMLELIIFFQGSGNLIVSYCLFQEIDWQNILIITVSFFYGFLPMEEICSMLFPTIQQAEEATYWEACDYFSTDYDKENPVTRKEAMKEKLKIL